MIKYAELVDYIKRNHVNWDTDLFDVLRGFFDEYSQPLLPSDSLPEELIFQHREFKAPDDGEYTSNDLMDLFST